MFLFCFFINSNAVVVLKDANFVEGAQPNPVKVDADYEGTLSEPLIIPVAYTPGSAGI